MGRHDRLTMLTCGAGGKQGNNMEPSMSSSTSRHEAILVIVYTNSGTHPSEKKDDVALGLSSSLFFLFLLFLFLSVSCTLGSSLGL
jgi:hypothetical protein